MAGSLAKQMGEEVARFLGRSLAAVSIAFIVVELGLRLLGLPSGAGRSVSSIYDIDDEVVGPFQPGAQVNDAWPPETAYRASFNSLGCRGAEPRDVDAPMILAMGDSMTYGLGVDDADTWPAILDRRLAEEGSPRPVVNLSSAALLMDDHLAYLVRALPVLHPGIVMLMLPAYAAEHIPAGKLTHHQEAFAREREARVWYRRFMDSFAITEARTYLTLWRKRLDIQARGQTLTMPDRQAESGDIAVPGLRDHVGTLLREFSDRVEAAGARFVLLLFPLTEVVDGKATYLEPWTLSVARELGITTLDLLPVFEAQEDPSSLLKLPYDLHPSPRGNAVVAEAALALLRQQGLLD